MEVEVIHSWSAPRSLSTSLMYSFSQRDDIDVLDEPLYSHFLRVSGFDRPYRDQLLSNMVTFLSLIYLSFNSNTLNPPSFLLLFQLYATGI